MYRAHNKRYFDRWRQLLTESPFKSYYQVHRQNIRAPFCCTVSLSKVVVSGNGIVDGGRVVSEFVGQQVYCHGADIHASLWRLVTRIKGKTRQRLRALAPQFVKRTLKAFRAKELPFSRQMRAD